VRALRARLSEPTLERLWRRAGYPGRRPVRRAGRLTLERPCVIWAGPVGVDGYGRAPSGRRAHIEAHDEANGVPPAGYQRHHRCGVRLCVEPTHLVAIPRALHLRCHVWLQRDRWNRERAR
jgi:hypothetical protein